MPTRFANMVELFERTIEQYGPRPLFGVKENGEWRWQTYAEFGANVTALRAALSGLGIGAGDRLAIICNNSIEWATLAHAAYGLAAVVVPMYESQNEKEWKYILHDCNAKLVLAANDTIARKVLSFKPELSGLQHVVCVAGSPDGALRYPALVADGVKKAVPAVHPAPSDLSSLIYTSGTTGNPKGVMLTHENIAANVNDVRELFDGAIGESDRSLSFLPWAHSFGQTAELHFLFAAGASMALAEAVDKIVQNLSEVKPTILISVPRIFNRIYSGVTQKMDEEGGIKKTLLYAGLANENRRKQLREQGKTNAWVELQHAFFDRVVFSKVRERFGGRLKFAVSGGAAISREVAAFIDNLGITVFEGYGLTETAPVLAVNSPRGRRIGSVGQAMPSVRIVIDKSESTDGLAGEIIGYGPNVMKGYYNLPDEDAKVFTDDHGFRTGDLGYLDAQGFLFITGRIKEQYKLENGKYVAPAPLEEALKLSPFLLNALVYGDNRLYNVALIVPNVEALKKWAADNGLGNLDEAALLNHASVRQLIEQQLDAHSGNYKAFEKVKKFAFIPEDFTTQNGMLTPKMSLKRRVIIDRYKATLEALYK